MKNKFQGTWTLFKVMLKHERIKFLIWLIALIGITLMTAMTYNQMYQNDEELKTFAIIVQNPVMRAMVGQGYPMDQYNAALVFAHEMFIFTAIAVAIMNIMFTVRLMRNDEEEGRVELIRSLPVGRYSYLLAASLILLFVNGALILGIGLGLSIASLPGINFGGAMLYGATLGLIGITFTSISAFLSQLTSSTKSASGLSYGILIMAYLIRAIGDVSLDFLLYLSPLGLISKILVFYQNHWWPLLILIGIIIVLGLVTVFLNHKRDLGAGLLNPRQGKMNASKLIKNPVGLVLRLEYVSLILWLIGFFFFTFTFGAVLKEFENFFTDVELFMKIVGPNAEANLLLEVTFFLIKLIALFGLIPAIIFLTRIIREENKARIEQLYVRNLSRVKYLAMHLIMTIAYTIIMQLAIVMALWLSGKATLQPVMSFTELLQLGLVYLPSIWVVLAVSIFLIGILPRQANYIWGYFVFVFLEFYLHELLKLPKAISQLSVFASIPRIPSEKANLVTIIIFIVISVIFTTIGLICYRKRDLNY